MPGDFLRLSRGWPLVARAVYRELLDAQWDLIRLPKDAEALREIVRASVREWSTAWPFVEPHFPVDGEHRQHYQLEMLRGESLLKHEARQRGAAKTNAKRWGGKVVSLSGR
jgi:uncharacterized protein YdaU (DUF1376 family)